MQGGINVKIRSKVLSSVLILSIIVSMLSAFPVGATVFEKTQSSFERVETKDGIRYVGATGNAEISEEVPENTVIINSVSDYNNLAQNSDDSKKNVATTGAGSLPSAVDNSASRFFPAIGDQGGVGSCQFWAQVYYQFTYTMNKEMGVTTTADNTFSPQWAYNIVASTDEMTGTCYNLYTMMRVQGNVFQSQVPYTEDLRSFHPTEEIWKTSIKYRLKDYQKIASVGEKDSVITSADDEDLAVIKTALANGDVLAFSSYIYSWDITKLKQNSAAPENKKYENQEFLREVDGSEGSHRLSLVGYNDDIWCDINDNNIVDDGEMGAFKIANSWSDKWGNNGYMWVSYDALNEVSCVQGATPEAKRLPVFGEMSRIDVMQYGEDSQLYLKYTLNTADRTQVKLTINAEKDGTPYSRQVYSNIFHGDKIAYDGSSQATDATMVGLLSNVVEGIKSEDLNGYSLSVTFEDMQKDGNVLTIKDVVFVDETAGKVYEAENAYPLILDGEQKTVKYTESTLNHAVVYYRGYDNPKISYKISDGEFSSVDMVYTDERRGYLYKYVIDLKENDSACIYFTGENGDTDDNSGECYTVNRGNNFFVTEDLIKPITGVITKDLNSVIDVDDGCNFNISVSGGYAPYLYRYTFTNLSTNEQFVEEFKEKPNTTYYFREETEYEVVVEVKDFSDNIVVIKDIVEVKNMPFMFKEMHTEKPAYLVGDNVVLNATTQHEKIKYTGRPKNKYDIVITDEEGNVCHKSTVYCKTFSLIKRYSNIIENFAVHKSGRYTATISSTDANNEFAQMSIEFDVFDKTIGDANSDGSISVVDATLVQRMLASIISVDDINRELSDSDKNEALTIIDATYIQRYVAQLNDCARVGEKVEYIPPVEPTQPTEPETEPTQPPTQPPVTENKVTFTNSHKWSGDIYCYYWSDSNKAMTSWPGVKMTFDSINEYGESMYTFNVPQGATYIIFTNGAAQTTDIAYPGGVVRYYPIYDTDAKGNKLVNTW